MSKQALISAYTDTRKYTLLHEHGDGTFHLETRQDCQPIVEFCKQAKDAPDLSKRFFRHVAEIPMSVIGQWMREGSLDDEAHIRRWLNDPENRDFRVWEGRV